LPLTVALRCARAKKPQLWRRHFEPNIGRTIEYVAGQSVGGRLPARRTIYFHVAQRPSLKPFSSAVWHEAVTLPRFKLL